MNGRFVNNWWLVAALVTLGANLGLEPAFAEHGDADSGVQVLTRGPVHEAFAETVTFDPQAGLVVPKAPPAHIEELPPEERPDGDNVEWIPGYWGWDDEREDFLWISGLWRNLPPGREWVPGYWGQARQGHRWTSGYWADASSAEREYLPEPPATAEAGPNIAQPSPDSIWLPGCWMWQQNRYAWRPGFWAAGHQGWDWVPAHYVWTPRGYVFVNGYYDYSVDRRGVLFSPVYFDPSVYKRRGFSYSPQVVINLGGFTNHLFLRPSYGHYYFGDYYGSNYSSGGFYSWFAYNSSGNGYDPFYAHQRWRHRRDRNWAQRIETDFHHRRDNEKARPPRTWTEQQELIENPKSQVKDRVVVRPYAEVVKSKDSRTRFQALDQTERQRLGQRAREVQKYRAERLKLETDDADAANAEPGKRPRTHKVNLPKSPLVARPADQFGKDHAPPQAHETPRPDPRVKPQPRQARGKPATPGVGVPQGKPQRPPQVRPQPKTKPEAQPQGKPQRPPQVRPQPKTKPEAQPQGGQPQRGASGKQGPPQEKPRGGSQDRPKSKPQAQPQGGQPQGGASGKPHGKPQGPPQEKPKGGSQDRPKKKSQE